MCDASAYWHPRTTVQALAMKKSLLLILVGFVFQQCAFAETLHGLELAPHEMRERHLKHLVELFEGYCLGKVSQQAAVKNLVSSGGLRPAKEYEGVYEEYYEGLNYAVTPDPDNCTVDVLLEYQTGRLLFSLEAVKAEIVRATSYSLVKNLDKPEVVSGSKKIMTVESHFQQEKTDKIIVLTYPTSHQDEFYMTITYYYE